MTTTRVKNSILSMTLSNTCVNGAVKTYSCSKRYINAMLRISVLNILYHRLNMDESEFISKSFENIEYKSFRPKSKNHIIREFHSYMTACKDALEKSYLKEFYLYFIDETNGDIVENYKFSFQYMADAKGNKSNSAAILMENTCDLLRNLEDLHEHLKLGEGIKVKAEFKFFDDTPIDYEPPGSKNIDEIDSLMHKIEKTGNVVTLGKLNTGFHILKCRGKGGVFNFAETTPDALELEGNDAVPIDTSQLTEDLINSINVEIPSKKHMDDTYMSSINDEIIEVDEERVECVCSMPEMDFCKVDTVLCKLCGRLYHAPCVGYLDKSFVQGAFQCVHCRDDDDSSVLGRFDVEKNKPLYRARFIIGVLYKYGRFSKDLRQIFDQASHAMNRLNVFKIQGNKINMNFDVLRSLFKFDYNSPDMSRLHNIIYEL